MDRHSIFLVVALLSRILAFCSADTSGYFNSFDTTSIYYEVRGSGFPVVLVHGFIVDGESWKKTLLYNDLLTEGYQVITIDMRGNGKSGKPHVPEAYENDAEAKDIMGLVKHLGLKRYNVVGYSRGSIITSRVLVLDRKVSSAVMGGMGSDFTNPHWPRREMFYEALMGKEVKELEGMVHNVQQAGLDQLALAYLQKTQPSTSLNELSKIRQPVLVICGKQDADNGSAEKLAGLIPHSVYNEVPGDHGSTVRSHEFSSAVVSFLKKPGKFLHSLF